MRPFLYLPVAAGLLAGTLFSSLASAQSRATTPCATVAEAVSRGESSIDAAAALACLKSVPIDTAAASKFITYFNDTLLQLHSNTAYLKDPPPSYQQPSVDLNRGLNELHDRVLTGHYTNEYDFEADVLSLVRSAHDGHLFINTYLLQYFSFASPVNFTSVSVDGRQTPQLWSYEDIVSTFGGPPTYKASPLKTINGRDASTYVQELASNISFGFVDPHADWNAMMTSAMSRLQRVNYTPYSSPLFIDEWMNVTYVNGTSQSLRWTANIDRRDMDLISRLKDGEQFYKAVVTTQKSDVDLRFSRRDARFSKRDETSTDEEESTPLSKWPYNAYPMPILAQPNLQTSGGGMLTGYLYKAQSLAVLSIPSFDMDGDLAQTFSDTVDKFIMQAKAAGIQHILFDVQGNGGGTALMAYEIWRHFFPSQKLFSPTRHRISGTVNVLGEVMTAAGSGTLQRNDLTYETDTLVDDPNSSPWMAHLYKDAATDQYFSSWKDMAGPIKEKGDTFSKVYVQDFDNAAYDIEFSNDGIVLDGSADRANKNPQPFPVKNMTILTDGQCSSTCSVFLELFHYYSGVKVVAVGGLPKPGPMQTTGGVRGMLSGSLYNVVSQIQTAGALDPDSVPKFPDTSDSGIRVMSGGYNLRDQLRIENGKPTMPLQFAYQAADCRIFYTPQMVNNYAYLWSYAAAAAQGDGSMCVEGSTRQQGADNTTNFVGPDAGY